MAKTEEQNAALEGKLKALQATMSKIEKDFGKGAIMKLGDEQVDNVEVIPTGSIGLDAALGVGGYPKPSTASMPPSSAWTLTISGYHNPTTVSRRSRLLTS